MRLIKLITVIVMTVFFSSSLLAKVYKCSDEQGSTTYQSSPCVEGKKAAEIHVKTGAIVDLSIKEKEKEVDAELQKLKEADAQKEVDKEVKWKADSVKQEILNLKLVKNNPVQYSAFAIPSYDLDNLPPVVKRYKEKLPEIEKSRRLATKKALQSGGCLRVESVELNAKSSSNRLVYAVDCSSSETFYFTEKELAE